MDDLRKITGLQNDDGRDGRKTEQDGKRKRVALAAICALTILLTAAGCGKVEEPVPVNLSSGNMEELQNDTAGDNEEAVWDDGYGKAGDETSGGGEGDSTDTGAEAAGSGRPDDGDRDRKADSGKDTGENAEGGTQNGAADMDEGNGGTDAADGVGTDASSAGSMQLEGDVRSVSADSFVICKHETWEEDGAAYAVAAAPGSEEESDLITIHVAQTCVYQYKTVKNSGINPEDVSTRDGSFADVAEGLAVTVRGSWQDDGSFLADSVVLSTFV